MCILFFWGSGEGGGVRVYIPSVCFPFVASFSLVVSLSLWAFLYVFYTDILIIIIIDAVVLIVLCQHESCILKLHAVFFVGESKY